MTSTEDLLQETEKYKTDKFDSGYHSTDAAGEYSMQQKASIKGRQNFQRIDGFENKGYESDNDDTTTSKGQLRRTSSAEAKKNVNRKHETRAAHKGDKRRHSYAGNVGLPQDKKSTQRRSSVTEDQLRRRACLNSMHLRSIESNGSLRSPNRSFHGEDVEDNVPGGRNEFDEERKRTVNDESHVAKLNMKKVFSSLESENQKLSEYSKRLSIVLQERANLEQELDCLRRAASEEIQRLPKHAKWRCSPNVHYSNEKLNSVRREKKGNEDRKLSLEGLTKTLQRERSRILPEIPSKSLSSGKSDFLNSIPIEIEGNHRSYSQESIAENNSSLHAGGKSQFKAKSQQETESKDGGLLPNGRPSRERTQHSEEKIEKNRFFLSEVEKQRRGRNIAHLAADLWQKLLQGEKFQGDNGPNSNDETSTSTKREMHNLSKERPGLRKGAKEETPQLFSNGKVQILEEDMTTTGAMPRLKPQNHRIVQSASASQEAQTKIATDLTVLRRSVSESNIRQATAFKRNQRRPLRYKRGSSVAQSFIATAKSSSSQSQDSKSQELQLFSNHTFDVRKEEPEKTNSGNKARLHFQNNEIVGQIHSKWFDYMLPPGKRRVTTTDKKLNFTPPLFLPENEPSPNAATLKEKLRFYQDVQEKRLREDNSFDLADAYVASKDAEEGKELQRQAAGEAVILRRQASHLLWQAMNLERICDPNARVRHIFTPY